MPNIADLQDRIKFQSLVLTSDGQGGSTETWTDFAEVWAAIEPKSARERLFSEAVQYTITHVIKIRWLDGINTNMRILYEGRTFQVHGARRNKEHRFFMTIDAEENVGT